MGVIELPEPQSNGSGERPGPAFRVPFEEQLANVAAWNSKRSWSLAPHHFRAAERAGVEENVVLVPVLVTLERTFDQLWDIIARQHPREWRNPGMLSTPDELRWRPGEEIPPGLHWRRLPPLTNLDTDQSQQGASVEVLAAAAHDPEWFRELLRAMPALVLPGLETRIVGINGWPGAPYLAWNAFAQRVHLSRERWDPVLLEAAAGVGD